MDGDGEEVGHAYRLHVSRRKNEVIYPSVKSDAFMNSGAGVWPQTAHLVR